MFASVYAHMKIRLSLAAGIAVKRSLNVLSLRVRTTLRITVDGTPRAVSGSVTATKLRGGPAGIQVDRGAIGTDRRRRGARAPATANAVSGGGPANEVSGPAGIRTQV